MALASSTVSASISQRSSASAGSKRRVRNAHEDVPAASNCDACALRILRLLQGVSYSGAVDWIYLPPGISDSPLANILGMVE